MGKAAAQWVTGQNAKSLTNNSRKNWNTRVKENRTLTESPAGWGKARSQTVEHKDKQLPVRRRGCWATVSIDLRRFSRPSLRSLMINSFLSGALSVTAVVARAAAKLSMRCRMVSVPPGAIFSHGIFITVGVIQRSPKT